MQLTIRAIGEAEAADASAVIHASFRTLAASGWEPNAQNVFLSESSPDKMARKLKAAALSFGAFTDGQIIGVLLMPTPTILGMLFVHPAWLRRGIARSLWEHARAEIERAFPTVKTIELNSTPYADDFWKIVSPMVGSAHPTCRRCVNRRTHRLRRPRPSLALLKAPFQRNEPKIEPPSTV